MENDAPKKDQEHRDSVKTNSDSFSGNNEIFICQEAQAVSGKHTTIVGFAHNRHEACAHKRTQYNSHFTKVVVHTSAHTSHTHHTESRSTALLEEAQPVLGHHSHHTQHHRAHTDLRGHHTPQTQISHATQTQSPQHTQHSSNQDVHEDLSGIGKIDEEDKGDKTENKRVDKVDKISDDKVDKISDDKVVKTEA